MKAVNDSNREEAVSRKSTGRALALIVMACLFCETAGAALYASMDRYRIAMGDTVRLTLRSDGDEDPGDADLRGLEEHFEILQRSSSVSTRIINGERSQNRELILELTPRREGSVVVPAFVVGKVRSEALAVDVAAEPQASANDEIATFSAELDRSNPYVQGQLLLTLRVQQAVNLESRSITELDIDNAYVEPLGQNSFQRTIDGRPWLVHEIRYAIFPESSGELVIPAQTFSGRLGAGRRTLFDTRPAGRLIRRRTEELRVTVRPRPAEYPPSTWLPAADLSVEEQWSAPLDQLQVGDSITRTVTITGEGLQGAQLPPIAESEVDGLRIYPDQPTINNVTGDTGITGIRSDSIALVAVRDGEYTLPAVEIHWWDTGSDTLRIARLPARTVRVMPPPLPAGSTAPDALAVDVAPPPVPEDLGTEAGVWPWITALCAAGWLLTTLYLLRRRPSSAPATENPATRSGGSTRELLSLCADNNPRLARQALHAWIGTLTEGSTANWLRAHGSSSLQEAAQALDAALYGPHGGDGWDGTALAHAVKEHGGAPSEGGAKESLPPLYLAS